MRKLFFILLTSIATGVFAQDAALIVQTDQVRQALARGAIIWDVRDEKSYLDGHIPRAINIGNTGAVLRDPNI